jgi:replicative DNA helicase
MSDLRDSGELEEHADMISFLYRPEYYNRDAPELRGIAEFIIAKQRNRPTPIVKMEFDYRGGRFTDERTP